MRSRATLPAVVSLVCTLGACEATTQGYFGPCDEPVGYAAGCEEWEEEPANSFTPADACLKLASCGILNVSTDPPDDPSGWVDPFEWCVDRLQATLGEDPGGLVLLCIEEATCADLDQSVPPASGEDPNNIARAEEVIGWCGRLDPR